MKLILLCVVFFGEKLTMKNDTVNCTIFDPK